MKNKTILFSILLLAYGHLYSQPARMAVMRINPFISTSLSSSDAAMMERLVVSYIAELDMFRIIDTAGQEMALSEAESALSLGSANNIILPLSADFIMSGTLGKIGDLFILTLEVTKVSSGEKLSVSDTAKTISDIVLRAKDLTKALLRVENSQDAQIASTASQGVLGPADSPQNGAVMADNPEIPAYWDKPEIRDLTGSWNGDKGIETIRILQNSTAIAVLSGGGIVKLRLKIDKSSITVMQDQPNDPVMYRSSGISFADAKKISELARPMEWQFKLSSDKNTLSGIKATSAVSGRASSLQVDNNYSREAVWTRINP